MLGSQLRKIMSGVGPGLDFLLVTALLKWKMLPLLTPLESDPSNLQGTLAVYRHCHLEESPGLYACGGRWLAGLDQFLSAGKSHGCGGLFTSFWSFQLLSGNLLSQWAQMQRACSSCRGVRQHSLHLSLLPTGMQWLVSGAWALPCLWKLNICHCNAEGHSFSFLKNPLPSPGWVWVYLYLMQTSICMNSGFYFWYAWKELRNVAHHLSAWAQKSFLSSPGCKWGEKRIGHICPSWSRSLHEGRLMEPFVIISDNSELWRWIKCGFVVQLPENRYFWSHPQVWCYKPCKVSPVWAKVCGFCEFPANTWLSGKVTKSFHV